MTTATSIVRPQSGDTLSRPLTAAWISIASALIVWPFTIYNIPSQFVGVLLLLPCFVMAGDRRTLRTDMVTAPWLLYVLVLLGLAAHIVMSGTHTGLLLFTAYIIKIPVLYVLALISRDTLMRAGFDREGAHRVLFLAVSLPLLVIALQLAFPDFHRWSIAQLGGFRATDVIEKNAHGHAFRFLGVNGFLFSSHGVAFALTALGLRAFRTTRNISSSTTLLFAIEIACLLMAMISGRSALPLVVMYLCVSVYLAQSWRRRLGLIAFFILIPVLATQVLKTTAEGRVLLYWMTEPAQTSLSRGKIGSNSMDETLESFRGVTSQGREEAQLSPNQPGSSGGSMSSASSDSIASSNALQTVESTDNPWVGKGIYFRDNAAYVAAGEIPSDAGFVRLIYVSGYIGLALFILFWLAFGVRAWFTPGSWREPHRLYLVLFLGYGMLFFLKSEWLYQNFFIFYFFSIYQYLNRRPDDSHAHRVRKSLPATS